MKRPKVKSIIIITFLFIFSINLNAGNKFGITKEIYSDLCGVWDLRKNVGIETSFSWGKARAVINGSIVIDLGEDQPKILAGPMGASAIKKIYRKGDNYVLRILFRNKKEYNLELTLLDKKTIVFHKMDWFKEVPLLLNSYGNNHKYYKLSGPQVKYLKPKISNLRIRTGPTIKSHAIRLLNQDEQLIFLKEGKTETIKGSKGKWIKVLTSKNEIGWCLGYYLE